MSTAEIGMAVLALVVLGAIGIGVRLAETSARMNRTLSTYRTGDHDPRTEPFYEAE